MTLYSGPDFTGTSRHLGDTGWAAYSPAALGLERIGSVRVLATTAKDSEDRSTRLFRAQLFDRAPVYLGSGAEARKHRLDIATDLADTGAWADRVRYVTVSSCRAADAGWGFDAILAAGEPTRYTLVEHPSPNSGGQDHSPACEP